MDHTSVYPEKIFYSRLRMEPGNEAIYTALLRIEHKLIIIIILCIPVLLLYIQTCFLMKKSYKDMFIYIHDCTCNL